MSKLDNINFKSNLVLTQAIPSDPDWGDVLISANGRIYAASLKDNKIYWCREGEIAWNLGYNGNTGGLLGASMSPDGDTMVFADSTGLGLRRFVWNYSTKTYDKTDFDPRQTVGGYSGTSIYSDVKIGHNGKFCFAIASNDEGSGAAFGYKTDDITAASPVWVKTLRDSRVTTSNFCGVSNAGENIIASGARAVGSTAYRVPDPATPTDYMTRVSLGFLASGAAINEDSSYQVVGRQTAGTGTYRELAYSTDFTTWNTALTLASQEFYQLKHVHGNKFIAGHYNTGIYAALVNPTSWQLIIPLAYGKKCAACYNFSRVICSDNSNFYVYDLPTFPATGKVFMVQGTVLKSLGPTGTITKYSA